MKRTAAILLWLLFFTFTGIAQREKDSAKPWPEWTKEDVDKMLNKSPWGHVVTNTDTSEMTVTLGVQQKDDGSRNQATSWNYRIRFFSAKPIREAFARQVLLSNPSLKPQQLDRFVNGDYSDSIVVAVTFDGTDRRYIGDVEKAFATATTDLLKGAGKTYIELKNGKQILLDEYEPPAKDGTGAKFVFPKMLDGQPFTPDEKEVLRFVAKVSSTVTVEYRFKIADMIYGGKLEF